MFTEVKRVAVTGGAGQIAYSILFRIASGELFGKEQPVALHILDLPEMEQALKGVAMELEDCAFPLLQEVVTGGEPEKVFEGVHYAFLIGAKPRGPGMERKDLLADNGKIFVSQGKALDQAASRDLLALVVGNPCNTNALIAAHSAPHISPKQFFAMTRLDQNRAAAALAQKAGCAVHEVSRVAIWGNHSSTQVPDFLHATIRGRPAEEVIGDRKWLEEVFTPHVQKRGAQVIAARGKSSAASAANAALDAMRSLIFPTPKGEWFSCAIASEGNPYGIKEGIFYSFPCRSLGGGKVEIVEGMEMDDFLKKMLANSEKELLEERELIASLL